MRYISKLWNRIKNLEVLRSWREIRPIDNKDTYHAKYFAHDLTRRAAAAWTGCRCRCSMPRSI